MYLNVGLYYYLSVAKVLSISTMSRSPHKLPILSIEGNYTLLTRGDLLRHVVGDRGLSALPAEPLVGPRVSTDGESEGLRLPPVFVHSSFHTEEQSDAVLSL